MAEPVRTLVLEPLHTGFKIWSDAIDDEMQRASIQKVIIQTAPPSVRSDNHHREPLAWYDGNNAGRAVQPSDYGDETHAWIHRQWGLGRGDWPRYTESISRLAELPNLEHLHLRFTDRCRGQDATSYDPHVEEPHERIATLEAVFAALSRRYERADASKVRVLTIENLQNMPLDDFTSSIIFKDVTQHLEELHLLVADQYSEHSPDYDLFHDERQQAESYIRNQWLVPISKQLKSLTICFQSPWGLMPGYFDGRGLQFPQLKRLNLGQYAVAHDSQWDWVLAQKSLVSLHLDECVIVSFIANDPRHMEQWAVATDDWKPIPPAMFGFSEEDYQTFFYTGTWATVYNRIRENLPNLVDFRFNPNSTSTHPFLELPYSLGRHLDSQHFYSRYNAFDVGILPSQWIEPDHQFKTELEFGEGAPSEPDEQDDYQMPELYTSLDRHKETEGDDKQALDALVDAVNRRRQERGLDGPQGLSVGCRPRVP